ERSSRAPLPASPASSSRLCTSQLANSLRASPSIALESSPCSGPSCVTIILFDTALEEAHNLPARVALAEEIPAPLLIIAVEDEVTGTGALVHRLIFGLTDTEGKIIVLRDWELLKTLNSIVARTLPERVRVAVDYKPELSRLKQAFDADLPRLAPTMHRPAPRPEMLLVPLSSTSGVQ